MSSKHPDSTHPSLGILRREFFTILGVGAAVTEDLLAQHGDHGSGVTLDFANYRPRALSPAEFELLDVLAETILPADETGPGAHEAHVAYYIDVVLTHGPAERRQAWKMGLADERLGQRFAVSSLPQRHELLAELARNEMNPVTPSDRFFVEMKKTLIEGFYASELIQREHLGYKGNTAVAEFPGCTHANFEHPDIA